MSFWQQVQSASEMGGAFAWLALAFVIVALILFARVRTERMRLRTALIFFVLSLLGFLIAGALAQRSGGVQLSIYRWVRWCSILLQRIAFVNVASVFLFEVILDPLRLRPPRIMRDLLLAFAYVVVAIMLISETGVDITGIVATSAVLTAVIGLSFQDTLVNMVGGMALQAERAFVTGDWIRVGAHEGVVKDIRWRHTAIETRNWDTVVIPNSILMKSEVVVLGRRAGAPRQHRQWVHFNVDFRYSPHEVIKVVQQTLRSESILNIARTPEPDCVFLDFKESFAHYAVRYWLTDLSANEPTNSVVRTRVYFALRRANIPLSIPAQSIFVTEDDASRRERKSAEEIADRAQTLKRVDLFRALTDEERKALAARLSFAPFVQGEAITRQGAEAHWLYLISKGTAEVRVSVDGGGASERVAELHEGDFFGEMGLMTGEPRTATVNALTDVQCYRLDKEAFNETLQRRPEIAEDISHILAIRRVELDAAKEDLTEESKRLRMQYHQGDFLRRIKDFFTL